MKARFTPSLITGNEMIDSHHKELIKRANDLFEALEGRQSKEKVLETLGFLADYTTYHFQAEEKLMEEEGMKTTPNRLIHIGCPIPFDTDRFLVQLKALMNASYGEDGDIRELVAEVVETYRLAGKI